MTPAAVRSLSWVGLSHADMLATRATLPPERRVAFYRAWLEQRQGPWLNLLLPHRHPRPYLPGVPRTDALGVFARIPDAVDRRPAYRAQIEQGRGLGKTETGRGATLWRLLSGRDHGVIVTSQRDDDAKAWLRWWMDVLPARGDAKARAEHRKTPFGLLYPDACYSGGETQLIIHRPPFPDAPIWARGASGTIRSLNEAGVRPTLAIADDVISATTAYSAAVTRDRLRVLRDDIAGLGTAEQPVAIVVLGNAYAEGDLGSQLAESGWPTTRGSVWVRPDGLPADGLPLTDALQRLLAALAAPGLHPNEALASASEALERAPGLLSGHRPADSSGATTAQLLCLQAAVGTASFARVWCCARSAEGTTLWPWRTVQRVPTLPAVIDRIGVWLDPRYSEDAAKNDFAAAAAVGRLRDGRCLVLAVEEGRLDVDAARGLYWRAMDRARAIAPHAEIVGGAESNGGVGPYLARDFALDAERRASAGLSGPVPDLLPSTRAKEGPDRLGRLVHPIESGRLLVLDGALSDEGERQCHRLGEGYHDDVPDAIERAEYLANPPVEESPFMRFMRGG